MRNNIFDKSDFNHIDSHFTDSHRVFDYNDNLLINSLIDRIDSLLNIYVDKESSFHKSKSVKREIGKVFDNLYKFTSSRSVNHQLLHQCLQECVESARSYVINYLNVIDNQLKSRRSTENRYDEEKFKNLKLNGFAEYSIEITESFENESQDLLDLARAKYENMDDWRESIYIKDFINSNIFRIIQKFIDDNGIFEMLSNYMEAELDLAWASPNYSHHRQQWFRIMEDEKLSSTNYYHLDKDHDVIKILIYLTDVSEGDGPFKYVKSSNLWKKSLCTFALHFGMDSKVNKILLGDESSFKNNIFTKRTDLLHDFPDAFIGSTHFGDFLREDSNTAKLLLNK